VCGVEIKDVGSAWLIMQADAEGQTTLSILSCNRVSSRFAREEGSLRSLSFQLHGSLRPRSSGARVGIAIFCRD
jgi:hypothetical protein